MNDSKKTREELLSELDALRGRLTELEQKALGALGEGDLEKKWRQLHKTVSSRTGELMMVNQELRAQQAAREKAEQACRNAIETLDRIFSTTQLSLALIDAELRFIRVNEGYAAAAGRPADFFPGKHYSELYPNEEWEAFFRGVIQSGKPLSVNATPFAHPDHPNQETTSWDCSLLPVRGKTGEVEGLLLCADEATERIGAEEALRKSEGLFRRVFDEAPIGAGVVGLDHRFQRVNAEYCRITGYSPEEMLVLTFAQITHPDDLDADLAYARALAAGEIDQYQMEKRYIRKDGEIIHVWLSVRMLRDAEGKPLYFLPLVEDITARKQSEKALRESEERYRLHFENVSDVVYVTDHEFRVRDISPSVKALIGYDPEEIIGHRIDELNLLAPEYIETAITNTLRIFDGHSSGPTQYEFITKDGARKFGEISGAPLWKEGKVTASIAVARDITRRKQIEAELERYRLHLEEMVEQRTAELMRLNRRLEQEIGERKKAEAQLKAQVEFSERLIESSADGIIAFDRETRFTAWNPPMERVTGIRREHALGKKALELFPYLKETGEDQNYAAVLAGGTVASKDRPYYIQETGREGFYEAHYSPLRNETGEIVGGLAIIRDITNRMRMEEVLRESEAQYRHLSESLEVMVKKQVVELKQSENLASIGKMISIVAHEIRNPLQNVQLGFETLRIICKNSDELEILRDVERGLGMLTETVEELLDFSRPTRLNRSRSKIGDIINQSIALVQPKLRNVALDLDIKQADTELLLDVEKVSRALMNLFINAAEAMPGGGCLRVWSDFEVEQIGRFLRISISDNGCGIPEDVLLQITEPFFTTKPRGTGLGLSICKKIVEAHGGHLYIMSTTGEGTNVEIVLPAES